MLLWGYWPPCTGMKGVGWCLLGTYAGPENPGGLASCLESPYWPALTLESWGGFYSGVSHDVTCSFERPPVRMKRTHWKRKVQRPGERLPGSCAGPEEEGPGRDGGT